MASLALFDLAKRAVSHPNTAAFAKRAVSIQNGDGDSIEMPTWGFVLIYVSLVVSVLTVSFVSHSTS